MRGWRGGINRVTVDTNNAFAWQCQRSCLLASCFGAEYFSSTSIPDLCCKFWSIIRFLPAIELLRNFINPGFTFLLDSIGILWRNVLGIVDHRCITSTA